MVIRRKLISLSSRNKIDTEKLRRTMFLEILRGTKLKNIRPSRRLSLNSIEYCLSSPALLRQLE